MAIKSYLRALFPTIFLVGFLTNSVLQRILGPVEGSFLWPAVPLVLMIIVSSILISKVDFQSSSQD